jgi:hypothetical protein
MLLAAILGALAVAGCGGGGSSNRVSANAYARALCTAVGPFEKDIAQRQSALDPSQIKSPTQGRTVLTGFLNAVAGDTKQAADRLRAAGVPDVSNGKKISTAFVNLFSHLQTALQNAAKQAQTLPTGSATAFKNAATQLGTSVRSSMNSLTTNLSQLRSPELEAAAKKVPACQTLGG